MRPEDSVTQQTQEDRYQLPLTWFVDPATRRGRRKFGRIKRLFDILPESIANKKILDFGCGGGRVASELVKKGAAVTGVDFSERALSFARLLVPGATFLHDDGKGLPYADSSFDYVTMFEVLEHIPPEEIPGVLKELARVLKPDGRLVLSVPSLNLDKDAFKAHFQHFSPDSLRQTLGTSFEVETMLGQDYCSWWLRFLSRTYDNRFVFIRPIASLVNERIYMRRWNAAPLDKAGDLFARFIPKKYETATLGASSLP